MKNKIIFLSLLLIIPFMIKAKDIEPEWIKGFGGRSGDRYEHIVQTDDGGYVVVGSTESGDFEDLYTNGMCDGLIVKYDENGNIVWKNNWGGSGINMFKSAITTEDDGIIVVGSFAHGNIPPGLETSESNGAIIIKYDKDGNMLWQKSPGGNSYEDFYSVVALENGDFIVAGGSRSTNIEGLPNKGDYDAVIIKYDKDGNIIWQKSWGGNNSDQFYSITLASTGDIYAAGTSRSTDIEGLTNRGSSDSIIVKFDKDGNMLWQNILGGNGSYDEFYSAIVSDDNSVIVVGRTDSTNIQGLTNRGSQDGTIVKYDKDGNMLWQKNWGGKKSDFFYDVAWINENEFAAVGSSSSTDIEGIENIENLSMVIVIFDKDGNVVWNKNYFNSDWGTLNAIQQTKDKNFIVVGSTYSDLEDRPNKGAADAIILKYYTKYEVENTIVDDTKGVTTVEQQGTKGIITPQPNEGYEVDQIIVKDNEGNILDVEVTKLEDGTYSFPLYTNVSIEVTYKEKISNPKTGILDVLAIIFIGFVMSLCGFILVKRYNERYEI